MLAGLDESGRVQMKYFIQAFKKDGRHVYRVWANDEHEYDPEMDEGEVVTWAEALVEDVGDRIRGRLRIARERGCSGVGGVCDV